MSYLRFEELPIQTGRTTVRVGVFSARSGDRLGVIFWWGAWRQYVVEFVPGSVWSDGCLAELKAKLTMMNARQRTDALVRKARKIDA